MEVTLMHVLFLGRQLVLRVLFLIIFLGLIKSIGITLDIGGGRSQCSVFHQ